MRIFVFIFVFIPFVPIVGGHELAIIHHQLCSRSVITAVFVAVPVAVLLLAVACFLAVAAGFPAALRAVLLRAVLGLVKKLGQVTRSILIS